MPFGIHYLMAVNLTDRPIRVPVIWKFAKPVQPEVLFEDRELAQPATTITDWFRPLDVHIYRWR